MPLWKSFLISGDLSGEPVSCKCHYCHGVKCCPVFNALLVGGWEGGWEGGWVSVN